MATNDCNKTKPCGCEDQPYASLPPCNPVDCPEPYPCSEVNNAECVIYTGQPIMCGNDVIVDTNTNVADALNSIADKACNPAQLCCPTFVVEIITSLVLEFGLEAVLTNGTAPFTYQWSYAQDTAVGDFRGLLFTGPTTSASVSLVPTTKYYLASDAAQLKSVYATHVKVKVTDANGQIAIGYYHATRVLNAPQ